MQANLSPRAIVRTIAERRPLIMSAVVLGWSIKYLIGLSLGHTTGPELYGVLTAALSTGAAVANLTLIGTRRTQLLLTVALLALWMVIALAGVAGTVAHIVGPVAGHGPVDLRPRPIAAPLIFTALGVAGGLALVVGRRAAIRRARNQEEN